MLICEMMRQIIWPHSRGGWCGYFLFGKRPGGRGRFCKRPGFLRLFCALPYMRVFQEVLMGTYDSAFLADFVFYFAGCQTVKGLNVLLPSNWTQEKIHFWISSTKIFETAKQTWLSVLKNTRKKRTCIEGYRADICYQLSGAPPIEKVNGFYHLWRPLQSIPVIQPTKCISNKDS